MKELDFSRISDEVLENAVRNQPYDICLGVDCNKCPFEDECYSMDRDSQMKAFQEELKRRQKMENKMPELQPGMMVKLENSGFNYVVMPNKGGLEIFNAKNGRYAENVNECHRIIEIYKKPDNNNYFDLFSKGQINSSWYLIWQKNSEKQHKKEALLEKIEELTENHIRQVEELKQQVEELDNE